MRKSRFWLLLIFSISVIIVIATVFISYKQTSDMVFVQDHDVIIFGDSNCQACKEYIDTVLKPALDKYNLTDQKFIDLSNQQGRSIYKDFIDKHKIPLSLKAKPTVSIKDKLISSGYVPSERLDDFIGKLNTISGKLLIKYDDVINPTRYSIWDLVGEPKEYDLNVPVDTYIQWIKNHTGTQPPSEPGTSEFILLIIAGGLIDGINPCAFAVLLFLITLLFSTKKDPSDIFDVGMCYLLMVFVVYFLIGLTLFETIKFTGIQFYVMLIAACIIILFGLINIKDSISKTDKPLLKIPERSKKTITRIAVKASIPAALSLGIFVSITEFACTGAIYLAVITLLSSSATYFQGVGYLVLYNIMFVLPLLIIILFASNNKIAGEMKLWREKEKKRMRLSLGIGMVLLGIWTLAMKYSQIALWTISALLIIDLFYAIYIFISVKRQKASP